MQHTTTCMQKIKLDISDRVRELNANADAPSRLLMQQELSGKRKGSEGDVEWPNCMPGEPAPLQA